jgi:hypothetical protein
LSNFVVKHASLLFIATAGVDSNYDGVPGYPITFDAFGPDVPEAGRTFTLAFAWGDGSSDTVTSKSREFSTQQHAYKDRLTGGSGKDWIISSTGDSILGTPDPLDSYQTF